MTADRAQASAASVTWTNAEPDTLMERVLAPANLKRAYQRVVSNKGAPGADGMTVEQLADLRLTNDLSLILGARVDDDF